MKINRQLFSSKLYNRACCLVLFFVAASASFHGYYDKWHFIDGDLDPSTKGKNNFEAMVDGTARRPFVYRQLLPMLANWVDRRMPEATKDTLFTMHDGKPFGYGLFDAPLARNRTYFLRYWIMYLAVFLFAWIAIYALYLLLTAMEYPSIAAVLVAVAFILLMPYLVEYYYDYPELAFMALVVWMALKIDWWWIVPIAALATWNKESFLLFIPTLYPLLRRRSSRISALAGTGVLGLTCTAVYLLLRMRFQHNPGGTVEIHIMDQIHYMRDVAGLIFSRGATYRVIHPAPFTIVPLTLIAWTVWRGWRNLPRMIQRHAQIAAVINFPLFLMFCWPGELRDLSLLYVTFLFLLAANVSEWISAQSSTMDLS